MAQFQVSTGKLSEEAAHLRRLKAALEQEIAKMRSGATSYLNMWEGEAKQAFVASVQKNMNLLTAFTNNMDKFADALTQSQQIYEQSENRNKQIAINKGQG
ncbi:MAG: WXG100 family type VII secretion target [Oscillibacter sp.]|nr:WXG100 family type VII secretion target [Oscillibacter sp.]